MQANDFEEALRCYRRGLSVLATEPRSDNYMVTMGVDKQRNSSDMLYATLNTNMGALLMRMERLTEAKAAFEAALAVVPDDGTAYLRLGQMALYEGKIAEGLALIKRSTECEPGNSDFLLKYLRACLAYGDPKEAAQSLEKLLAAKKSDPIFLVTVGCLLDDESQLEPALRCFDTVLEFDEDLAIAWYNKGVALQRAGRDNLAIECYETAIRLDRHHSFARCYLGVLLIRRGQEQEGLMHLQKFLDESAPSALTDAIKRLLQTASLGFPLAGMTQFFSDPQTIKHVV